MKEDVPKIGKKYYFFDDGKVAPSRCYIAEVKEIITKKEAKKRIIRDKYYEKEYSLYRSWRKEVDNHREDSGDPWLYAEDTDYFIACSIPNYDDNLIWFVRDIYGNWFSININNRWQSGKLDVSGNTYADTKAWYDLQNYDGFYDSLLNEVIEENLYSIINLVLDPLLSWLEQNTHNVEVVSSSLTGSTIHNSGNGR